jgi:hypothetical protein
MIKLTPWLAYRGGCLQPEAASRVANNYASPAVLGQLFGCGALVVGPLSWVAGPGVDSGEASVISDWLGAD